MKIFSLITLALLGISSLCGADPAAEQDPPGSEITGSSLELEMISKIQDLIGLAFTKIGVTEATAAMNLIVGAMGTATASGRRSLEGLEPTEILGEAATEAIAEAVEEWLPELPEEVRPGRKLQGIDPVLIVRAVSCIILSIFIDNILYSQVEDLADYEDNAVCIKSGKSGFCPPELDPSGDEIKKLKFVPKHAKGGEFLYHDKGPKQLQGVFWLYYPGYCSSMVSFAETVEQFPLSTGELREPALPILPLPPSFTYDGFTYNIRVSGASNWAFAEPFGFCYDTVEDLDLIYGIKPLDVNRYGESWDIDDPKGFVIVPSIKIPILDLRVSIDSECTYETFFFSLLRFEMHLVPSCNDINETYPDGRPIPSGVTAKLACEDGAVIWERRTFVFQFGNEPPADIYYVIQIVDGCGEKVEPAYGEWQDYHGSSAPVPYVNQFRSLDNKATKQAKSAKEEKSCKKSKSYYFY